MFPMLASTDFLFRRARRLRDTRGAAMTEYTVLVGMVALVSLGALIAVGVAIVNRLEFDRTFLLGPIP
jgi:Flp pilus assembly pilin Flp